VIDVSGSMLAEDPLPEGGRPETGGDGTPATTSRVRLERAKAELLAAIEGLPKSARFTIFAYSGEGGRGRRGRGGPGGGGPGGGGPGGGGQGGGGQGGGGSGGWGGPTGPASPDGWLRKLTPGLVPATPAAKRAATDFVTALEATG